jgi:hypothetical protein
MDNHLKMKTSEKTRQYHKEWRSKNQDRIKIYILRKKNEIPTYSRRAKLKSRYGMSVEDLTRMTAEQNKLCKICGKEKELVVDHDHKTGKVRGLLCRLCNIGLGSLNDNVGNLENAIKYLTI